MKKFKNFKKKIQRGFNHNYPMKKRSGTLKKFQMDLGALEPDQWGGGRRRKWEFCERQETSENVK